MIVASMRNNANPPSMINCSMRLESNSRDILTFPLIVRMATRVAHNVLAVLRRGDAERMQVFAKELVALQPHVLFARSTPVTAALLRETHTIPIVFTVVSDPVGDHLVESLARPGGNVTGFTNVESSLAGKWLELLKQIAPSIKHSIQNWPLVAARIIRA